MSCRLFRSKVVAFADGELPPDEARLMQDHIRTCAECATELAAVERETEIYTAALRTHAAPADLADGVMDALEGVHLLPEQSAPPKPTGIPLRWVVTTAAVAAALLFVMMGGMGIALNAHRAAEPAAPGWRVVPALGTVPSEPLRIAPSPRAVQVEGFDVSPSGGRVYHNAEPKAEQVRRAQVRYPVRLVSFDGQPLHQPAPAFEVEEYRDKGDAVTMNKGLGRPQAVTAADQQRLSAWAHSAEPGAPRAMVGAMPGGVRTEMSRGVGAPAASVAAVAPQRPASEVVVDSTDAQVALTVGYEKEDERYVTIYDADFAADYVIRAPATTKEAMRIAVTFPFPSGCSTVSGSKLLVDEKADDDHTTYSITGIRWVNWFKPKEMKTISIAYKARGQGNYRYVLDKVNLTRQLRLLMRIDGIEPGREIEIPTDSLTPGRPGSNVQGRWDYAWDYTRLLTTKDIAVNFPTKESPSVAAGRVMQTVGQYLFVARLAPIFLVVFLAALALGGVWNRDQSLKVEEMGLLGIAFLLFYPLFLFGAGYLGRDAALAGAVAIVAILSAAYAARVHGPGIAARVALLDVVLLGAFNYALFDKALTGLIFTVGATLLLAYFMLLHGRKAAERTQSDPAAVARAEMPRPTEPSAEEGRDA